MKVDVMWPDMALNDNYGQPNKSRQVDRQTEKETISHWCYDRWAHAI